MKHLNVAALALMLVLTSGYALRNYDGLNDATYAVNLGLAPAPKLKPERVTYYQAGRLGRLSLHAFGNLYQRAPIPRSEPAQPHFVAAPRPLKDIPSIDLSPAIEETEALIKLDKPIDYKHIEFTDKLVNIAEDVPIQRKKHPCAASSKSIKSLGMERQITDAASLGVEYVYKEKCHARSMSALTSQNLPDETGVKLRLNMRF